MGSLIAPSPNRTGVFRLLLVWGFKVLPFLWGGVLNKRTLHSCSYRHLQVMEFFFPFSAADLEYMDSKSQKGLKFYSFPWCGTGRQLKLSVWCEKCTHRVHARSAGRTIGEEPSVPCVHYSHRGFNLSCRPVWDLEPTDS